MSDKQIMGETELQALESTLLDGVQISNFAGEKLVATIRALQERLEGQRGLVEAAERYREAKRVYEEGQRLNKGFNARHADFMLARGSLCEVAIEWALSDIARQPQPPPDERGAVEGQEVSGG